MPRSSARSFLILLAAVVVLAAAYTAGGFLGVPALLRSQIQQFTTEHYGRAATVGQIRFNPFTFALEMQDFSFADADGEPLLSFQRLFVQLDIASIWRRGASFRAIELDQPYTRTLIRPDGSLNLADLAKPFAAPPGAAPEPPSSPARLFIDRLRVTDGAVGFEDRTHSTPFRAQLRPVTFELRDFSTTGQTGNEYMLQGASAAGERFSWNGAFRLDPLASRGRFSLTEVQARTLWSYLRDSLGFEVSSGVVGLTGDYDFGATPQGVALKINVGDVDVADLGLRPRGHADDYVKLARIKIENTRFDLAGQRVDVGKIRLTGGEVRAWREADGRINLLELNQPPARSTASPAATTTAATTTAATTTAGATTAAQPAPAEPASSAPSPGSPAAPSPSPSPPTSTPSPWVFSAPDIGVDSLRLALEDRFVKPAASFTIDPVNVHIEGFSNAPGVALNVDASLTVGKSGLVKAKGTATPDTSAFRGAVEVAGLDLAAFQPYVGSYTQMTLLSGLLSTKLDVDLPQNGAFTIKGDTDVSKLRTVDNALRQDFIKWDQLRLTGIDFHSSPASLKIATIVARAPYMRVIIAPDQTVNLSKVLSAPASAPGPVQTVRTDTKKPDPTGATQPMPMSIGTVRITNGSANFADFWIKPNYAVSIQGLNGAISGLSSEKRSRAKLKLEGKVDRYAPALIEGDVNLLSASLYSDIKVSFQGVDMTSVTPYSGRFAGYRIEKGKLSVNVEYHVENRQLKAEQRFVIDQLQLGDPVDSPDAVHLPLRLAIALLKDRNGVIDIGLPVSGSLDDPKFRIGPIIWKAVVNLLEKIATAPFALLGRLFGGGEEMNLVDFEPGVATLDPAGQQKMVTLLKALKERPQLKLDVPMTYSPDVDGPVLASSKLNGNLMALAHETAPGKKPAPTDAAVAASLTDPATRFDLLVALYRRDFGADAPLPAKSQETFAKRKKERDAESLAAANAELETAIEQKNAVSRTDFEELGAARARAIQDALLAQNEVEAARVFLIAAEPKPAANGKARLELSLK